MRIIRFLLVISLLYAYSCFAQWQSLTTNIGANDCQFVTPCKGIAVEGNGRVYQTFDGGASWTEYNVSTLPFQQRPWLHSLDFINDSTLFAVGGGCFKSTDFGVTWTELTTNMTTTALFSVQFLNSLIGYIGGGDGNIIKTMDGGATWTLQPNNVGDEIHSVSFSDPDTGWVVSYYKIAHTTNGGQTWTIQKTDYSAGYWDCYAINGTTCIASGYAGRIEKTTNGGVTWTQVNSIPDADILDIDFCNDSLGYAVGAHSTILKTSDGGNTWIQDSLDNLNKILFTVDCISSDYVYVMGGSAVYNSDFSCFNIVATADGPGEIEPEGIQTVAENSSITFNFYPNDQVQVAGLSIDGVPVSPPSNNSYTFNSVIANHTIEAYFGTGINENDLYFTIFPNPTSHELVIRKPTGGTDPVTYELIDLIGRVYLKGSIVDSEQVISIDFLPSSIYFLKITENNKYRSYKIVKQ